MVSLRTQSFSMNPKDKCYNVVDLYCLKTKLCEYDKQKGQQKRSTEKDWTFGNALRHSHVHVHS